MLEFRWGRISLEVPEEDLALGVPYATYVVDEYYFLDAGPNDVVVDAGAYMGDFTAKAAARAKLVVAIEPNPESVELLRRNVRGLRNVVVVEVALGERPGLAVMEGSGGSAHAELGRGGSVKVVALDDLMEELGVEPTLLKMDIEGAECAALRGGLRSLKTVRRAVIELHGPQNVEECPRLLEAQGFRTAFIGDARALPPRPQERDLAPYGFPQLRAQNRLLRDQVRPQVSGGEGQRHTDRRHFDDKAPQGVAQRPVTFARICAQGGRVEPPGRKHVARGISEAMMKRIIDGIHAITTPMSLALCPRSPGDRRKMGYSLGAWP